MAIDILSSRDLKNLCSDVSVDSSETGQAISSYNMYFVVKIRITVRVVQT